MVAYRNRRILIALVSDFISRGEPVASAALAREHGLALSSATIRAVLAELEADGYLVKPHASAGRVPTDKAFQVFVETILSSAGGQSPEQEGELERRYSAVEPGLDPLMRQTGKILAELSRWAAVVVPPRGESWVLRDLRFISLRPTEVLAVIVASNGAVQNRVLRVEEPLSPAELDRLNNLLRRRIEGRTLGEVRAAFAAELEAGRADATALKAVEMGHAALAGLDAEPEVLVEGAAQLVERTEFASREQTVQALRTLDDHERLLKLLDRALAAPGIQVVIGSAENAMGDLSLVAAPFGSGAVGVIGSNRMDYSRVVPLVRLTARRLARMLGEMGARGPN